MCVALNILLTITFAIDRAFIECHDVLRQGTGLVAEDIFDLTQLFIQSGGPRLSRSVTLGVIHLPVPVNVKTIHQTDGFHAEKEKGSCNAN